MISFVQPPTDNDRDRPIFEPGQLVRHRRYNYRGVVVDRDATCQADHEWYTKNQTQPDRKQPWYHVLVDGTATCTYVASENLVTDESGLPIEHPLLWHLFREFERGRYVRNDIPWTKL